MKLNPEVRYCHWEVSLPILEHRPISGINDSLLPSIFNHFVDPIVTNSCAFGRPNYI